MAFRSEDAGPGRLKHGVLEGRHEILPFLDRVRVFADLVADVLPAQAHRRHDAFGRQLEGQILENRGERRQWRCVAGGIWPGQRRRGRPGGERARERRTDGLASPRCGWRVAAGIDERGHGFF